MTWEVSIAGFTTYAPSLYAAIKRIRETFDEETFAVGITVTLQLVQGPEDEARARGEPE